MGIGDDGGDAPGQYRNGELGGQTEAALDMYMCIDQTGRHIRSLEIKGCRAGVAITDACDAITDYRNRCLLDAAREDVDDLCVA